MYLKDELTVSLVITIVYKRLTGWIWYFKFFLFMFSVSSRFVNKLNGVFFFSIQRFMVDYNFIERKFRVDKLSREQKNSRILWNLLLSSEVLKSSAWIYLYEWGFWVLMYGIYFRELPLVKKFCEYISWILFFVFESRALIWNINPEQTNFSEKIKSEIFQFWQNLIFINDRSDWIC